MTIILDGASLRIDDVVRVARQYEQVALGDDAREAVVRCRLVLDELAKSKVIYGINTGFGALSDIIIPSDDLEHLQLNLVRSHASGVDPALPMDVTRAMILQSEHAGQGAIRGSASNARNVDRHGEFASPPGHP